MPRLESAQKQERSVYFVDAAHFVLGSFIGYLWCIVRIFIPTSSGRSRYNVLGAINAVTHQLITVCNQSLLKVSQYERKKEMDSLLSLKFQFFDNAIYNRA